MEGNKQFNVLEKSDNHEIHCSYMTGPGMLGPHTSYYTHLTYVDKTTRPETRYHQGWDSRFPELGDHVWGGGANWPDNVAIALEQYRGSCIRPPGPIGGAPIKKRKSPKRHKFKYNVFYLHFDLTKINKAFRKIPILSINKFNIFSFFGRSLLLGFKVTNNGSFVLIFCSLLIQ